MGNPIALEIFSNGYRFLKVEQGRWQPETRDAIFKARSVFPKLKLELKMGNKSIVLNSRDKLSIRPQPQIVFTPDGDITPFKISLSLPEGEQRFVVANTFKDGLQMTHTDIRKSWN